MTTAETGSDELVAEAKLREILDGCEGVVTGPWSVVERRVSKVEVVVPELGITVTTTLGRKGQRRDRDRANAAHIARLDPATAHSIVTEVLASRAEIERLKADLAETWEEAAQVAAYYAFSDGSALHTNQAVVNNMANNIAAALRAKRAAQPGKPKDSSHGQ